MKFEEKTAIYYMPHRQKLIGIYFLLDNDVVIYVGQSINILARISTHRHNFAFNGYSFILCDKSKLDELEDYYIIKYQPRYNRRYNIVQREKLSVSYKHLSKSMKEKITYEQYSKLVHEHYIIKPYREEDTIYISDSKDACEKLEKGIYEI